MIVYNVTGESGTWTIILPEHNSSNLSPLKVLKVIVDINILMDFYLLRVEGESRTWIIFEVCLIMLTENAGNWIEVYCNLTRVRDEAIIAVEGFHSILASEYGTQIRDDWKVSKDIYKISNSGF